MIWKAAFRISPSAMTPTCTTFLIVSHVPDRNEVIPFQIFENVVAIVSNVPVMKETIPSHIPVKNEAIPVPDPLEKVLDRAPCFVPAGAKPAQNGVGQPLEGVDPVREGSHHEVPDAAEDFPDALPDSIPVTGKYTGEHVEKPDEHVQHYAQNIADLLEYSLEYGGQQLAEAVPDSAQHLGYVLKLEAQLVEPVGDCLPELVKLGLYPVPDRRDLGSKFFVVLPEVREGEDQRSYGSAHGQRRGRYAAYGSDYALDGSLCHGELLGD